MTHSLPRFRDNAIYFSLGLKSKHWIVSTSPICFPWSWCDPYFLLKPVKYFQNELETPLSHSPHPTPLLLEGSGKLFQSKLIPMGTKSTFRPRVSTHMYCVLIPCQLLGEQHRLSCFLFAQGLPSSGGGRVGWDNKQRSKVMSNSDKCYSKTTQRIWVRHWLGRCVLCDPKNCVEGMTFELRPEG